MARRIDVTLQGMHQLLHRLESKELVEGDWAICAALVLQLIVRMQGQQERMAAKLAASAANQVVDGQLVASTAVPAVSAWESTSATPASETGAQTPETKKKVKGHGRNGAAAFVSAKHLHHSLAPGLVGTLCPECKLCRLTRYREKTIFHLVGQPLFGAEAHHFEQCRCRNCGKVIQSEAPGGALEGIGSSVVYDWSFCAMLIVMHYFAAMPFKRLESLHRGWGIPLSDSNLWRVVDEADDLLLPLYRRLELFSIQHAVTLIIDDTGSMVVALARMIQEELEALVRIGASTKDVRTGINATGIRLETASGPVFLFFTGRHHAGEVLDRLLEHRKPTPDSPRLVKVTDAASKNFDHRHSEELVEAACNAHAFLKFRDIKDKHPVEYGVAGRVYKAVFDNDDMAKQRRLSPEDRMLFHREHSKPLMAELKAMCEEKLKNKLVEPNSALWEPLSFIINQWLRLTRFYEVPGVPLDSNLVEQSLIIPVRYLAASFNYQTETGAEVGDRMMSLIATARANGVEPVAYLTHCLRNHRELSRRPDDFLPWVFRERQLASTGPTGPPTSTAGPAG